jgi:hypothetical protein
MIEIYLFVNPLGEYCFEMEQPVITIYRRRVRDTIKRKDAISLSSFGQFADNWGCHATKRNFSEQS